MKRVKEKISREMRSGIYTLIILHVIDILGETYGYEIQKYVEEKTEGFIKLKDATVYPVLRYLVKKRVLHAYWTEPDRGVPRKYYSLTEEGRKMLKDLIEEYKNLTEKVNSLLEVSEDD